MAIGWTVLLPLILIVPLMFDVAVGLVPEPEDPGPLEESLPHPVSPRQQQVAARDRTAMRHAIVPAGLVMVGIVIPGESPLSFEIMEGGN